MCQHPCFKEELQGEGLKFLTSVIKGGFPLRLKKRENTKISEHKNMVETPSSQKTKPKTE